MKTVKLKILLEFTSMMKQMVSSGMNVKESIEAISKIKSNKEIQYISSQILYNIKRGIPFSQSINNLKPSFPSYYCSLISICENMGKTKSTFSFLEKILEQKSKNRDKLMSIMIYPTIVLCTAGIMGIILTSYVLPQLIEMFNSFESSTVTVLTLKIEKTRKLMLYTVYSFMTMPLIIKYIITLYKKNHIIKSKIDRISISIPIVNKIIEIIEIKTFSYIMEILYSENIPIEDILAEASKSLKNNEYKLSIGRIKNNVKRGISLSQSFSSEKVFPSVFKDWLEISEKTGKGSNAFHQINQFYESESNKLTSRILSLIDPSITLFIGLLFIVVIVNIIIPVFNCYGTMGL